jgi:RNA polymerase sigma-70 factor, ECF subfamily
LNNRTRSFFKFLIPQREPAPLGSSAGFSAFYERTHLPVFRYLYGLTGGPQEDVEDLTAEAYMRAWRARRVFQGDQKAELAWLMKISRRLVIDEYRRRRARPLSDGEIPSDLPLGDPPPEEAAQVGEERQALWALLQSLPDEPREMLILRYLLGWQVTQIAAYLEIPDNTVSVTIHRTLERLRQRWPQED